MRKILFRVEGGLQYEFGTGHLRRSLLLAQSLPSKKQIAFCMKRDSLGEGLVKGRFPTFVLNGGNPRSQFEKVLRRYRPEMVVFDKLDNRSWELEAAKRQGALVVTFDDRSPSAARLADIRINAIFPTRSSTVRGYDFLVLTPKITARRAIKKCCQQIFISFGGYDANRLIPRVLKGLLGSHDFLKAFSGKLVCVCGKQYENDPELETFAEQYRDKVEIHIETSRFGQLLAQSDVAILSAGLSLFQALQEGVPSLVIAQYPHQEETARRLIKRKAIRYLGNARSFREEDLLKSLLSLMGNFSRRREMGRRGRSLIDGRGLKRVCQVLTAPFKNFRSGVQFS